MTDRQTVKERRIETVRLLQTLRHDGEKPYGVVLRALRFMRDQKTSEDLGWIRGFAEGMTADNWQDMQMHIIRQLDKIGAHGETSRAAKEE